MSQPSDATAARELPPNAAAKEAAGWKLVEDAPATADQPTPRHRAGAQRGMVLLLLGGGLFWGAVAVALWFATHSG
jgi:hypothetical protein